MGIVDRARVAQLINAELRRAKTLGVDNLYLIDVSSKTLTHLRKMSAAIEEAKKQVEEVMRLCDEVREVADKTANETTIDSVGFDI